MAKVYAKYDMDGKLINIGSDVFLKNFEGWVQIDEGTGDRYVHSQGNFLDGPVLDEDYNIPLYERGEDGKPKMRKKEEIEKDIEDASCLLGTGASSFELLEIIDALLGGDEP